MTCALLSCRRLPARFVIGEGDTSTHPAMKAAMTFSCIYTISFHLDL